MGKYASQYTLDKWFQSMADLEDAIIFKAISEDGDVSEIMQEYLGYGEG